VKGAVYTGSFTSEWDGLKEPICLAGGLSGRRGLAVTQITEGKGSAVMKDGKPAGSESSGKAAVQVRFRHACSAVGKDGRWETQTNGLWSI